MKIKYDEFTQDVSVRITKKYSTSFSLGILSLSKHIRPDIYAIYGFVRLADEIVDSFHGFDKAQMLADLKAETIKAIDQKISINPIINSFQKAVNTYQIDWSLIETFMHSMEMDLEDMTYDSELYKEYIMGSAEVVGLMCLKVFVHGDEQMYNDLKSYAQVLGSAFQKVNFLRDLKDDYQILGRTYFPNINMEEFNHTVKLDIEKEIHDEFQQALIGIKKLPKSSKFGVYLAYVYYLSLFKKIQNTSHQEIINKRIRIHNGKKLSLMFKSYMLCKMQWV